MNRAIPIKAGLRPGLVVSALLPLLVAATLVTMLFVEPRFFNRLNIMNVLRNFSIGAIVALAQMLVMMVGGFDLSVGAIIALSAVVAATVMTFASPMLPDASLLVIGLGVAAALASGMLAGMLNGTIIARIGVSPFMTTMAMASVVLGCVFYYTKGVPIYGLPEDFGTLFGSTVVASLPIATWFALVVAAIIWLVVDMTRSGRHLLAVGGNPHAARSSGVNLTAMKTMAYVASGALAALAGVLLTARIGSGQSVLGTSAAIESIAACVIAGVSLRGGAGSPWRVVLAALFLAILVNALNLARIDSKWQAAALGIVLLLAVALEARSDKEKNHE